MKTIVLILVALMLLFLILGVILPGEYRVERSITRRRSPSRRRSARSDRLTAVR